MPKEDYFKYLEENLQVLINHGKIGLHRFQPTDIQTKPTKILETRNGFKNYHFFINVPYAGKFLNWEILFDPEDFSELPDFDFNDCFFLPEPDINYIAENVPSWDNWDLSKPQAMLNILNEFFALHKKSQIEKLFKQNKYLHLKKQYQDLLEVMDLPEDKIEVLIENKGIEVLEDESTIVHFLINLPIDFSELPEYYQDDAEGLVNPGEDFASLLIQVRKLDLTQVKVSLTLSPRAEQVLGKLKLPKFRKDASLVDYAQAVLNTVEEQVDFIAEQHHRKNLFISAIVDSFSSGIVEYDATRFDKVSFIYEDFEDYDCLIIITLGNKFPLERPKVAMQSLYCQVGRPCSNWLTFLYDPEHSMERVIKNLRDALKVEARMFQNHKH